MRRPALALAALVVFGQHAWAQTAALPDRGLQMSACHAWQERVSNSVRRSSGTGLLPEKEAAAVNGLIDMIGKRCDEDPHRMSELFAIVLDALSDQRYQP